MNKKSFYANTNNGTEFLAVLHNFMARFSIINIINNNKGGKAKTMKGWNVPGPCRSTLFLNKLPNFLNSDRGESGSGFAIRIQTQAGEMTHESKKKLTI
jgi:hypothetical protein